MNNNGLLQVLRFHLELLFFLLLCLTLLLLLLLLIHHLLLTLFFLCFSNGLLVSSKQVWTVLSICLFAVTPGLQLCLTSVAFCVCQDALMRALQLVSDWVKIVYSFGKRLIFSPLPVRLIELHPVSVNTHSAEPLIWSFGRAPNILGPHPLLFSVCLWKQILNICYTIGSLPAVVWDTSFYGSLGRRCSTMSRTDLFSVEPSGTKVVWGPINQKRFYRYLKIMRYHKIQMSNVLIIINIQ